MPFMTMSAYLHPPPRAPPFPAVAIPCQGFAAQRGISDESVNEKDMPIGAGGGRRRGTAVFHMSTSAADPDYKPHVAIAGISSHLHPSDGGALIAPSFPTYRGSGSLGVTTTTSGNNYNSGGGGGDMLKSVRSGPDSFSPLHGRRGDGSSSSGNRRESGGSGALVPAEAECSPPESGGIDKDDPPLPGGVSIGGGGGGGGSSKSKPRRGSRRSSSGGGGEGGGGGGRSSRRKSSRGDGGGMRPAMPAAGPSDEMRLSPEPDDAQPPGPWVS